MSRRHYGEDADAEMKAARERHEAAWAKDWKEDQIATEKMWREGERRRQAASGHRRPHGDFQFTELLNESGGVSGWRAHFDGKLVGMLIIHPSTGDLVCLASGDSDDVGPSATDIMAAFLYLYPAHRNKLPEGHPLLRGER